MLPQILTQPQVENSLKIIFDLWYNELCHDSVAPLYVERYRSGHNGAVLKTVRVQAHMGSNPILSASLLIKSIQRPSA